VDAEEHQQRREHNDGVADDLGLVKAYLVPANSTVAILISAK
jgi:hypothetical protein